MTNPSVRGQSRYVYRRDLGPAELLPALGVAIGVGALAFYLARILLERTPLEERAPARLGEPAHLAARRSSLGSTVGAVLKPSRRGPGA